MRNPAKFTLPASTFVLAVITVGMIAGCPGKRTVAPSVDSSREVSADDLLQSAIHQLRPENYSIAAATDKPVALLSSWLGMVSDQSASEPAATLPEGWLAPAEAERMNHRAFDLQDGVHIRDSMLTHAIATFLSSRGKTELQRVGAVFDFVVRNISLRGPGDPDLPLGVYELLLLGKGSAEDRALIFAALLKQLRMDVVIVQSSDIATEADAWLVGAILNDKIYLFDPRLGLAIPSTTNLAEPLETPATLDQIADHEDWLKLLAFRADQPYPIEAKSLKQPRILPIVDSNSWFHRMKQLEEALPGKDLCVLWDPLVDEFGRTGCLTRLSTVIQSSEAPLQPWPYSRRAFAARTPEVQQNLVELMAPFELPIPVFENETTKVISLGTPERKMLRIRTDQLLGNFEDATKRYFSIRHLEIDPDQLKVPQLAGINRLAAEDAIYWSAICKFEAREFDAAIEQLNGYLKRYERNGRWNFAARALLADCHAKLGKFGAAAAVLERSSRADDPYRNVNAFRIRRWNAQAGAVNSTSDETR